MSYVMAMDQTISEPSGYSLYGEAIVGSEGDTSGTPDIDTGDSYSNSYAYLNWGGDTADGGLDTGSVPFQFDGNLATGVSTLSVDGSTITYSSTSGSNLIGSAQVRIGADVPAQVSLNSISMTFYQGTSAVETDTFSGMSIDTTAPSSSGCAEDILTVTPNSSADNEVVISGTLRMIAPVGTYPGPTDTFSQAFVTKR